MNAAVAKEAKPGRGGIVAAKFLGVLAVLSLGLYVSAENFVEPPQTQQQPVAAAAAYQPTILLTGFEPFGKGRPPNPSWESVKELDGKTWKGYKLVARQLPVVWGAPMQNLPGWITEYKPVAVFSFGQGGKGSFTVESLASNSRGKSADNNSQKAPTPEIVKDGPAEFKASMDCEKMASFIANKGFPVKVSTKAGRYLCEENLYTLEYLKTTNKMDAAVMFCHVPPLDTAIGDQPVTAAYVRQFVEATLAAWHTLYQKPEDPRQKDMKEIKDLIGTYFRTWSEQDIKGYAACFLPDAHIQQLSDKNEVWTSNKADFIASQADYHRTSPVKTVEVPESVDIHFEAKLARVLVYWKLTAGPRTERGYDHFTLVKKDGNWRILNLVFYASDKKISD